jgi:hypothetical protein
MAYLELVGSEFKPRKKDESKKGKKGEKEAAADSENKEK